MLEDETHKQVGFLNIAHHYSLAFQVLEVTNHAVVGSRKIE